MTPSVSFVVPCYKLAHLLKECVDSILAQSFKDLEVLIMDDCSPDNTREVAQAFKDPRVQYVRNEPNLGSLKNYNKGVSLSKGRYVWLISADDYLRKPYIVERYVKLMEANPNVGYVFCAGIGVLHGRETKLLEIFKYQDCDEIVNGRRFLEKLVHRNFVLAPSGMVRRECYEKIGLFPLDPGMVWSGDWYLWSLFALYYDVAYFAKPMVCYREHELSMTNALQKVNSEALFVGDIAVPWMIKRKAQEMNFAPLITQSLKSVSNRYARCLTQGHSALPEISLHTLLEKFEFSLRENSTDEKEKAWLRGHVYVELADHFYSHGDKISARKLYESGLNFWASMPTARMKLVFLRSGKLGEALRSLLKVFKK